MRKVENFIFVLFSIVASFICLYNIYNDEEKIKSDVIGSINKDISLISEYARNLSINFDKSGTVKLNALYKGAHGESNPNEFNYNFKMNNGIITLENEQGFVNYDLSKIYNLVNTFSSIKSFAKELIVDKNVKYSKTTYKVDQYLINEIYNTNFSEVLIEVNTTGFIKKVKEYVIVLDDYKISTRKNKIVIQGKDNKITLTTSNKGYSLNINDKLKVNVIDFYQYNIFINGTSLFMELTDNNFYLNALTTHAIYNALEITGTYDNVSISKTQEAKKEENPINRYFNEVDFGIWE